MNGILDNMKLGNVSFIIATVFMLVACGQGGDSPAEHADGETVILAVEGMNCAA